MSASAIFRDLHETKIWRAIFVCERFPHSRVCSQRMHSEIRKVPFPDCLVRETKWFLACVNLCVPTPESVSHLSEAQEAIKNETTRYCNSVTKEKRRIRFPVSSQNDSIRVPHWNANRRVLKASEISNYEELRSVQLPPFWTSPPPLQFERATPGRNVTQTLVKNRCSRGRKMTARSLHGLVKELWQVAVTGTKCKLLTHTFFFSARERDRTKINEYL